MTNFAEPPQSWRARLLAACQANTTARYPLQMWDLLVWTGHTDRALALADAGTVASTRVLRLRRIADALSLQAGNTSEGVRLDALRRAAQVIDEIQDAPSRTADAASVAVALHAAGDVAEARRLLASVDSLADQTQTWRTLAAAWIRLGDDQRARALLGQANAHEGPHGTSAVRELCSAAVECAHGGQRDWGLYLLRDAEARVRGFQQETPSHVLIYDLACIAVALAALDLPARAHETMLEAGETADTLDHRDRGEAARALAPAWLTLGAVDEALREARVVATVIEQITNFCKIAVCMAQAETADGADRLLREAETLALEVEAKDEKAMIVGVTPWQADRLDFLGEAADEQAMIVEAWIAIGRIEEGRRLAATIPATTPREQAARSAALASVAASLARTGASAQALSLLPEIEQLGE
ncbi:MAG: hypothetical protein ACR2M0_08960 [Chloroflexia bacterium]